MYIGPTHRTVTRESLKKVTKPVRTKTQASSDIDEAIIIGEDHDRRKKQDRRKRTMKPLLDLRSGKDRRKMSRKVNSIDITV